jgi:hypothetical protein
MFRFTIRDVLWLTLVVALGCAFVVERLQKQSIEASGQAIQAENGYLQEFINSRYESIRLDQNGWHAVPKKEPGQ